VTFIWDENADTSPRSRFVPFVPFTIGVKETMPFGIVS
jgi:hypothetical protein